MVLMYLFLMKLSIHVRRFPPSPSSASVWSKMVWSTVSKAAFRSKKTTTVTCPSAIPFLISNSSWAIGSRVDLPDLNPCCVFDSSSFCSARKFSLVLTRFSISLLRHCSRVMGLYDSVRCGFFFGFSIGMIRPVFHA